VVEEPSPGLVDLVHDLVDGAEEEVVKDEGDDGDQEAARRRDEGLVDPLRERRDARAGVGRRGLLEARDHARYRPQEAEEGREAGDDVEGAQLPSQDGRFPRGRFLDVRLRMGLVLWTFSTPARRTRPTMDCESSRCAMAACTCSQRRLAARGRTLKTSSASAGEPTRDFFMLMARSNANVTVMKEQMPSGIMIQRPLRIREKSVSRGLAAVSVGESPRVECPLAGPSRPERRASPSELVSGPSRPPCRR
jgi:hypothetical protein